MKLFKYEGYEVKVVPEALALKPFKKLWDRDKSKAKERAVNEFAFLYFYCDPRSDYQYITDDSSRLEEVKKGLGLPEDWKPDTALQAAIDLYSSFETASSALLKTALIGINKVQKKLSDFDLDTADLKSINTYMAILKMVPQVATMLKEAEDKLNQEAEFGEARGQIEKAMFDDGLDDVADWLSEQEKYS
jgi:hypothetical protein